MNLWPFSKKADPQQAAAKKTNSNPHSRKMELPSGVKLADPSECDLPAGSTRPAGSSGNVLPEATAAQDDAHSPALQPEQPSASMDDLAFIPKPIPPQAEAVKPDLPQFFEQNHLEMVSQSGPLPFSPEPLATPNPTNATEALPDWMNIPAPPASAFEANPVNEPPTIQPTQAELPTLESTASFQAPLPEVSNRFFPEALATTESFDFLAPPDLQASNPSYTDLDTTADLFAGFGPAPELTLSGESAALPPQTTDAFETPLVSVPEATTFTPESIEPLNSGFATSEVDEHISADSFFMFPTEQAVANEPNADLFGFGNPPEANLSHEDWENDPLPHGDDQTNFTAGTLPNSCLTPPENNFESDGFDPLSLTQSDAMPTLNNEAYLPSELTTDDSFDLDSLLGGQNEETALNYELESATIPAPDTDMTGLDDDQPTPLTEHYFGDEAEGLKGSDNLDSYDFGHYEDPDEPSAAFVLGDKRPETNSGDIPAQESVAYDNYENDAYADLSFGEVGEDRFGEIAGEHSSLPLAHAETETSDEASSYITMASLPSTNDFMRSLEQPVSLNGTLSGIETSPDPDPTQTADFEPELSVSEPVAAIEPESQAVVVTEATPQRVAEPFPTKEASPVAPKAKAASTAFAPEAKASLLKYSSDSLAERLGNFEQEVLLKNSQFLSHSIDQLVNGYFAQQDQNAS